MKTGIMRFTTVTFTILLILLANSKAANAASAYEPSAWSAEKIAICDKADITPEDFDTKPYTDNITRKDFCELMVNACHIYGITLPELPKAHPFTDTQEPTAEYAYMLGLTNGTAKGTFSPELPLSREMAAAMLSRLRMLFQAESNNMDWNIAGDPVNSNPGTVYRTSEGTIAYIPPLSEKEASKILTEHSADHNLVSDWAKTYMADVYSRGILSGSGGGRLDPSSNIVREQAAILSLNLLAYYDDSRLQSAGIEACIIPRPTGIYISPAYDAGDVFLKWNDIPSAAAYDIEITKEGVTAYTTRITSNFIDLCDNGQPSRSGERTGSLYDEIFGSMNRKIEAAVKVTPVDKNGEPSLYYLHQGFDIRSTYVNDNELITGDPARNQFADINEANQNMTGITVNVWNLTDSGSKKPSTITFKTNINAAETLKKIFEEIYNGKEKFPIKSIIGYSYRDGKSQHSNGTAIDINPDENYFISSSGTILAGKLWKPGINPYSILAGGDVVRAFNRYGWDWSPDMNWSNGKDYMHFSLVGR